MQDNNLNFAKIVSIPTLFSWSQAYNAGKLFAVLSLNRKTESDEKDYLNLLGKEILETLEQEYFTLETKDLNSIKNAVLVTSKKIPDEVDSSLVVTSVIGNILYAYIFGKGKVSLKRDGQIATILEKSGEDDEIKTSSGYLKPKDVIVVQTREFSEQVSQDVLSTTIDSQTPDEIVETLAPALQEKGEGGASAIILKYIGEEVENKEVENGDTEEVIAIGDEAEVEEEKEETNDTDEESSDEKEDGDEKEETIRTLDDLDETKEEEELREEKLVEVRKENLFFPVLDRVKSMKYDGNHSRRVIMTVVAILIILFIGSVFLAIKKQNDAKTQSAFNEIYVEAQKKYEEGQNLLGLNESLAKDSFTTAKDLLEDGKSKFSKGSGEEKKIEELLSKVNDSLSETSGEAPIKATEAKSDASDYLSYQLDNSGVSFAKEDSTLYILKNDGIYSTPLGQDSEKKIVEEDLLGNNPVSVSGYIGRLYVLDKGEQIYKLTKSGTTYTSSDYFTGDVNLDSAVSISIDGSIWVLSSSGKVDKYTRGESDDLSISGLDKGLKSPTKIYTDSDIDNVYILDRGNSRVVVIDKEGKYVSQYASDVIKNAKDFDISETDKKIYVLSGNKIYEINLK